VDSGKSYAERRPLDTRRRVDQNASLLTRERPLAVSWSRKHARQRETTLLCSWLANHLANYPDAFRCILNEMHYRTKRGKASWKVNSWTISGDFHPAVKGNGTARSVEKLANWGKLERARIIDRELSYAISLGLTLLSLLAFRSCARAICDVSLPAPTCHPS